MNHIINKKKEYIKKQFKEKLKYLEMKYKEAKL